MKLNIPSNTEYLTWQDSINHYIDDMSQLTILETGIGKGSEFLVNKFKHVYLLNLHGIENGTIYVRNNLVVIGILCIMT